MKIRQQRWFSALRQLLVFLLVFVLISALVDQWRSRTIPHQVVSAEPMTLLDGTHVDLLALSYEQPVLVYFWATWCGVCRFVSPSVSRLAGGDHAVVSIAIASGESERVHAYQQAKNYRFNTINDPRNTLAQAWGIRATPTLLILKHGEVVSSTTGITTPVGMWLRLQWHALSFND